MIALLVAMDRNRVIGLKGDMPWHLPKDLAFFKQKTTGHTIVMGRKTFESIGRTLPNRRNIVLSSQEQTSFPAGVEVIHDLAELQQLQAEHPDEELFVIGGGRIFEQTLPKADRMYITYIDEAFQGDTYFPEFTASDWKLTSEKQGETNESNPYKYYFRQYDRK